MPAPANLTERERIDAVVDRPTSTERAVAATSWPQFWRVSGLAHTTFAVLRFTYLWLDDLARDDAGTAGARLIEECTGAFGSWILSGVLFAVWRHWPLRDAPFGPRLPGYLGVALLLSAANTTFMWASRTVLFPLLGRGSYDYGRMPLRYLMEVPGSLIGITTILLALWLADSLAERRLESARALSLERALTASRLRALQLQLQPHFLFNALNTIAARLHEDPQQADDLIGRLADLLRAAYRRNDVPLVPLREEFDLLDAYAALMRARFGSALTLDIARAPSAEDALVPPLLLQPLVENAVRHGRLEREGRARIDVQAVVSEQRLSLSVTDDGPGFTGPPPASGTGLSSTTQRLALLFGNDGVLTTRRTDGGFEVLVTLPLRRR